MKSIDRNKTESQHFEESDELQLLEKQEDLQLLERLERLQLEVADLEKIKKYLKNANIQHKTDENLLRDSYHQHKTDEKLIKKSQHQHLIDEQKLKASNQQLMAANQQQIAANQQLVAVNQQLVAVNQQLVAGNQQIKASELEIQESEKQFRYLMEQAPIAIQIYDTSGLLLKANKAWANLWNLADAKSAEGKFNILNDSQLKKLGLIDHVGRAFSGDHISIPEIEFDPKIAGYDGTKKIVNIMAYPLIKNNGDIRNIILFNEDITEQKLAKTKLIRQKKQLEMVIQGANIGWWDWEIPTGKEVYNDILPELLGYESSEIVPHIDWWKDKIHPDDFEQVSKDLQDHFEGKTKFYVNSHRLKTKSGEWKWFFDHGKVISKDENDKPLRMIGSLRDIDEQYRSKDVLQKSEEYFRSLIENSSDAISIIDEHGINLYQSASFEKIMGYNPKDRIGKSSFQFIHPDDQKRIMQQLMQSKHKHGIIEEINFRAYHKNGSLHYLEGTAKNLLQSPTVKGIIINYRDITDRIISKDKLKKKTQQLIANEQQLKASNQQLIAGEQQLRATNQQLVASEQQLKASNLQLEDSEKQYRILVETIPYGIQKINTEGIIVFANSAYHNMLGYENGELIGKSIYPIQPNKEARNKLKGHLARVLKEKPLPETWFSKLNKKDGEIIDVQTDWDYICNDENEVVEFVSIITDITQRKKEQQALLQRENYLSVLNKAKGVLLNTKPENAFQQFVNILGTVSNVSRTYIFLNHMNENNELLMSQKAEYCSEGIKSEIDNPLLQNLGYKDYFESWRKPLSQGKSISGLIKNFPKGEREFLELEDIKAILIIPIILKNDFIGFIGFDNCVSEREWNEAEQNFLKSAAKDLAQFIKRKRDKYTITESEEKYRMLTESIKDVVVKITPQGKRLYVSPSIKNFVGFETGSIEGDSMFDFFDDERDKANAANILQEIQENKKPGIFEFTYKPLNSIREPFPVESSYNPTIIDGEVDSIQIVMRDITERKQAEAQTKKDLAEKRTLLQELYHRTKNNMQVISAMLRMQSRRFDNQLLKTAFKEIDTKIQTMSLVHQKLFQTKDLSSINLKEYIQDLITLVSKSNLIMSQHCNIIYNMQDVLILIDAAIPLGLVINELISNIFKHALCNNDLIDIHVQLFKEDDGTINLIISDNGVGLPAGCDLRKTESMGISTVFALIEHQMNGEINYVSDKGLSWIIRFTDQHKERV